MLHIRRGDQWPRPYACSLVHDYGNTYGEQR